MHQATVEMSDLNLEENWRAIIWSESDTEFEFQFEGNKNAISNLQIMGTPKPLSYIHHWTVNFCGDVPLMIVPT